MKKSALSLLSAVFTLFAFTSPAKDGGHPGANPQTYVLVHGAWQAPYVWDAVRVDLVNKGHKVVVVELPGHGADKTPPQHLSLDVYRDKVIEAITKAGGKVILVGHSMGGMVVTAVAEKVPSRISKLVYIGAFLPTSGQALTDMAFSDPDSKLGPLLLPSADRLTLDVKHDSLTSLFIHDGAQATKEQVLTNYRAEPAIPFTNKVTLTNDHFGAVEKVYIKTLRDVVISPGLQDRMIAGAGITTVYEVNTSHSPFLAQPQAVSNLLLTIGQVTVLTQYEVKKSYTKKFRKLLHKYVRQAIADKNNIMAEAYYEQENPSILWVVERWDSKNGLENRRNGTKFKWTKLLAEKKLVQPAKTIYVNDMYPISKNEWRKAPQKDDKPITIMLFVDSKVGTEGTFKEAYHTAMPQFRSEPGVINYQLSQLEDDSTQFVTYEKFRSEDAFQYHLNFPPIRPVIDYLNTSIKKQPFQTGLHRLIPFAPKKQS